MTLTSLLLMKKNKPRKYPPNRLQYFMDRDKFKPLDLSIELFSIVGLKVSDETVRRWAKGQTDLTHESMIDLAKIFKCRPYELIADKEEILNEELAYLNEQRRFFNAYEGADDNIKKSIMLQLGITVELKKSTTHGVSDSHKTHKGKA